MLYLQGVGREASKSLKQGSKAQIVLAVITYTRNIMLFPRICPQSECLYVFHFIPSLEYYQE